MTRGASKGRRPSRNVFKDSIQSKLIESITQDIADISEELYNGGYTKYKTSIFNCGYLVPDATAANTITAGSWNTRRLNASSDTGQTFAVLDSNRVRILAGYYAVEAEAALGSGAVPVNQIQAHQLRIRDVTNGVTLAVGIVGRLTRPGTANLESYDLAYLGGCFAVTSTISIELQHNCTPGNGYDTPFISPGFGENQLRACLRLIKLS